MQIRGEEFIKKVQIQQEREELERKLNELEEVQMSFNTNINEPVNFDRNNNYNNYNNLNINENVNDNELDNIMLGSSISNEDNKKKYLILGIVLVVLFLLTIIIIRLLTNEPPKEDQFTTNNLNSSPLNSSPTKKQDNDNIEENFQKIMNERVKKDSSEPMVPEVKTTTSNSKTKENHNTLPPASEESSSSQDFDNLQKEAQNYAPNKSGISDEAMDQTIRKIEKSKNLPKDKPVVTAKETTPQKEVVTQKEEVLKKPDTKKSSIRDLMDSAPYSPPANNIKTTSTNSSTTNSVSNSASGYFIQIGAFTKKPTDSYLNSIKSANLKYKIYEDDSKGTVYNKVLIGPYSSKEAAAQSVENVKEKLNVTSAFVVKF